MHQSILNDNKIGKLLLKLTIPAFFGMFVMTLYNIVDTIFIGHYVGPMGIAGLSIVFPVQMLVVGIGQMMGMGGSSLISRLLGANRNKRAEQVLGNALAGSVIFSLIIVAVCYSNMDFWLRLMGASDSVLPYAREYFRIILIGLIIKPVMMSLNNLIRSEGNSHFPMKGMMLAAGSNIILDAVFIIPMNMGITGAALATILSQIISSVYFLGYYLRNKSYLKFHKRNLIINWHVIKDVFTIGAASLIMTVAGSIAAVFINRILVFYGGDLHISAYGIINRVMMLAIMPGMVIGQGLQPILGFNYGAGMFDRAMKSIWLAVKAATACNLMVFIIVYFFPEFAIGIFTKNPQLLEISIHAAKRMFIAMPIVGVMLVGSTVFQALGKVTQAIITSISRSALFLLPMIYILPKFFQADGVWMAFPVTDLLTCILTAALLIPQLRYFKSRIRSSVKEAENIEFVRPVQESI